MAYDLVARLRLIDNMSGPLRNATKQLKSFDTSGKQAFGGMSILAGGLVTKIAAIGAAVGATKLVFSSFEKAMNFESQMSSIEALTGSTKDQMATVQALALKMGAQTKYSALEAAKGIEELLKAGVSLDQVINGGLLDALNLATAGGLELADAAEIMSTAMNAYKRDAISSTDASNILAGAANASATSVQDLRYSLAAVSAVASGIGMTFRDTNIALGLFANNGLKGSDAGTSLKSMLSNLQPTTKQQIALFQKLGIMTANGSNKFFTAEGRLQNLDNIAGTLRESMKDLTDQQRTLALEVMFGSDAIRAGNILFKEGADGVKKFNTEMSKVTALDVAKKKMDNASGAVEQFKGALETLQISALLPTLPIIKKLALGMAELTEKYTPRITAGIEKAVNSAKNYVKTNIIDNPDFQKIPDIQGKIFFVIDTLLNSFQKWLDNGGQDEINNIVSRLVGMLTKAIESSTPLLADAALTLGKAMGEALVMAFGKALADSPYAAMIAGGATGAVAGSVIPGVGTVVGGVAGAGAGLGAHYAGTAINKVFDDTNNPKYNAGTFSKYGGYNGSKGPNGRASGLEYVPYNGYLARLHKGERVLTPEENSSYGTGATVTFGDIHINGASGNVEEMADQFMRIVARRLNEAGGQSAK